jgi:hypothetical protein
MRNAILTIDDLLWAQENDPELVKECFKQVTIMEDLESYLLWLYNEEVTTEVVTSLNRFKKRGKGIHPSSACKKGVCPLKLYYECTHEIEPRRAYDPEAQKTWDVGTALHDQYQAHFHSMYGDQFDDEVKLTLPKYHVVSRTDGIFTFPRVRIILEMKSIKEGGNFGWEKIQAKPMDDNVRQSHFYMRASDIPFAIVFYMNKNSGKLKEHPIMFDPAIWADLSNLVGPVADAAFEGGEMVKGTPGWHCRWCDFNYACPAAKKERSHVKGSKRPWGRR